MEGAGFDFGFVPEGGEGHRSKKSKKKKKDSEGMAHSRESLESARPGQGACEGEVGGAAAQDRRFGFEDGDPSRDRGVGGDRYASYSPSPPAGLEAALGRDRDRVAQDLYGSSHHVPFDAGGRCGSSGGCNDSHGRAGRYDDGLPCGGGAAGGQGDLRGIGLGADTPLGAKCYTDGLDPYRHHGGQAGHRRSDPTHDGFHAAGASKPLDGFGGAGGGGGTRRGFSFSLADMPEPPPAVRSPHYTSGVPPQAQTRGGPVSALRWEPMSGIKRHWGERAGDPPGTVGPSQVAPGALGGIPGLAADVASAVAPAGLPPAPLLRPGTLEAELIRTEGRVQALRMKISSMEMGAGGAYLPAEGHVKIVVPHPLDGCRLGLLMKEVTVAGFSDVRAQHFGFALGDRMLQVNGFPVMSAAEFSAEVSAATHSYRTSGRPLIFDIWRSSAQAALVAGQNCAVAPHLPPPMGPPPYAAPPPMPALPPAAFGAAGPLPMNPAAHAAAVAAMQGQEMQSLRMEVAALSLENDRLRNRYGEPPVRCATAPGATANTWPSAMGIFGTSQEHSLTAP